jgi:hypothetical protein
MSNQIYKIKDNVKITYEDDGNYAKIHIDEFNWLINQAEKVQTYKNQSVYITHLLKEKHMLEDALKDIVSCTTKSPKAQIIANKALSEEG